MRQLNYKWKWIFSDWPVAFGFLVVLSSKEDVSISCENLIWRTSPSSDKYDRRYDGIIIPG